jgi:putative membrane protein
MIYDTYFLGMNLIWWMVWSVAFLWVFILPFGMPGQRRKKSSTLDILQTRYTNGEISLGEYKMRKEKYLQLYDKAGEILFPQT